MKQKLIQKMCKHHGLTDFVLERRGTYRCRQCRIDNVTEYRRVLKLRAVAYKGGRCEQCGFDGHPAAFDFHHRYGKDFTISKANAGWERLQPELDKCDLLCANCHRIEHAKEYR